MGSIFSAKEAVDEADEYWFERCCKRVAIKSKKKFIEEIKIFSGLLNDEIKLLLGPNLIAIQKFENK